MAHSISSFLFSSSFFFLNETSLVPPFRVEGLIVRKGIDLFAYKLHEFSVVGLEA